MALISPQLVPLDAPTLVQASAGTGKTYTITTYFVRGVLEKELSPEQILVVTYTKAATAELRSRTRRRLVEAIDLLDAAPTDADPLAGVVRNTAARIGRQRVELRLRSALAEMDRAAIFTIHGFCQRLLQDYPLLFGVDFDFEVSEGAESFHADLAADYWTTQLYDAPEWLVRTLELKKVNAKRLAQLARLAHLPGIELIGPAACSIDESRVARWPDAARAVRGLWAEHRAELLDIVAKDPRLDHRRYPAKSVRNNWAEKLDDFAAEAGFRYPPAFFDRLAAGRMFTKGTGEEPSHAFFDACAELWEHHEPLVEQLDYAAFAFQAEFVDYVRARARARRDERATFDYDDLLSAVYETFDPANQCANGVEASKAANTVAAAYPLALVDEFQDTDSIQYGIFRAIYGDGAAVYVGDPKQAIYAFRGADVYSYLGAVEDIGSRRHTLDTNRRSDPGVVHGVNALFSLRDRPFNLEGIAMEPAVPHHPKNRSSLDPALELLFIEERHFGGELAKALAPIVANEIGMLLSSDARIEDQRIGPGDVAVLCRSNAQALAVADALRALAVPVSLEGASSVLETEMASDLGAILEATFLPGDSAQVRRALLTPLLGVTPEELPTMEDHVWSDWVSKFARWHDTWHTQGAIRFIEDMLRDTGAEARIAQGPLARRNLADLLQLEELLLKGERRRRRDPGALLEWFRRLGRAGDDDLTPDDLKRRPDSEAGAVRVSTIHQSKGLEYPIVYCPFTMGDAKLRGFDTQVTKFHDDDRNLKIDLGSAEIEEHKRRNKDEAMSDALRLLYVAVTRAKHQCTLFWGPAREWKSSALAFLLHGKERIEKLKSDQLLDDVRAFSESNADHVGWRLPQEDRAPVRAPAVSTGSLRARARSRSFVSAQRLASFTSITGHDEKTPGPRLSSRADERPEGLFEELRGGTRTGLLLHSILEHASFEELAQGSTRQLVEDQLRAFGFDPSISEAVQQDLVVVASTPLPGVENGPCLGVLPRDRQLRELEFTLSAGKPKLSDLAAALRRHGAPLAAPSYPDQLDELHAGSLQPYLRGFIDLVFEWEGRWYVADYKSNLLPEYEPDTIIEAVQREHYLLQAQLYTAAAHRFLRQQVPGYTAAQNWGGALFLFLRGMRGPALGSGSVFFERQPPALLDEVDRWLGGGARD